MVDNKVSDKVVWEEGVTSDNDFSPTVSQPQSAFQPMSQPQMMFCYKCNNVIPSDSKYCPCCKIELYTVCPKCGVKYSSQYPICSQCGTDRQEYLHLQRKEQERIERIKREERIKQEKLERERQEKERQERLKQYAQQESERQQKEAYLAENKEIIKTAEYISLHSLFTNAFNAFNNKCSKMNRLLWGSMILVWIYLFLDYLVFDLANQNMELFFTIVIILCLLMILAGIICVVYRNSTSCREHYLQQYIFSRNDYDKSIVTTDLIKMVNGGRFGLSNCCIIAYREKHGLPVIYRWH